jgi:hypothetical protein
MKDFVEKATYFLRFPIIDRGQPEDTIILAGMGRSGTTWGADIINHDNSYRAIFEPFLPAYVKEASGFEYIQYLNPQTKNDFLACQAKRILTGKTRNQWVDKGNPGILYRHRLVKTIRANLMLAWLRNLDVRLPLVLMVRHPLQVVASWLKLGWGKETLGRRSDFEIITSQQALFADFPVVSDAMKYIDTQDNFERTVFQWCVFHFIPFHQLKKNEVHLLFYEQLVGNPTKEVDALFRYLNKPIQWENINKAIQRQSRTGIRPVEPKKNASQLVLGWKSKFTTRQIQRANEILRIFGMDNIYDQDGYPTEVKIFRE